MANPTPEDFYLVQNQLAQLESMLAQFQTAGPKPIPTRSEHDLVWTFIKSPAKIHQEQNP
ncbi:hypothetical protein VP01_38g11 [Puccinia sorghi]|uniref:Uncharacterized protein n=1 Tax=Puccinia sorghi TaxID=27349 RepID=A0A0L6UUN8_9BASI|nr:hypothetical protein VP01_38g11 [Puccinia sorghi]